MSSQVFKFDLDKPSELEFKVSVDGVSSDSIESITYRFLIEGNNGLGLMLPAAKKSGGDQVMLTIPANMPGIEAGKEYKATLEAVVGNVLLRPAEIGIEFEKSIVVEVAQITPKATNSSPDNVSAVQKNKPTVSYDAFQQALTATKPNTSKPAPKPAPSQVVKVDSSNVLSEKTKTVSVKHKEVVAAAKTKKEEAYITIELVNDEKPGVKPAPEKPIKEDKKASLEFADLTTLMENLF